MWRMKDKSLHGLEKEKLTKNFWTYAVLLSALGAMTFFGVCDPSGRRWGKGGSGAGQAASVGGEVVSRDEFNRAYQRTYSQYQRMYQESFDPAQLSLARRVLTQLVDEHALYARAVELGLRASDDEILQLLAREEGFKGEDGKFSDAVFSRFLEGNGYTESSFLEEVRRGVTLQRLRSLVNATTFNSAKALALDYQLAETKMDLEYLKFDPQKVDVVVNADDVAKFLADDKGKARVKEYFEANPREFNRPEEVRARHILVAYKGSRNATPEAAKRDKDAARKRADEVLAKAGAPGADFVALAKEYTDEAAGKTSGGDLGLFDREKMDKAFSDAAFVLQPGQMSAVVETPFGFHIIKVEERKAAVATKLEQAQSQIAQTLLVKERRPTVAKARAEKVLNALKAKENVDALLGEDKIKWESTGDVAMDARFVPGIGASKDISQVQLTLKDAGQLFPSVVDVRGNLYLIRLKARHPADLSKLTAEKRRELGMAAAYTEGNALYTMYEKQVRDETQEKKKIWLNPDYLALDTPKDKGES